MSIREPLTPEEREEREESLREPDPPSHLARWGKLIWIGLTCSLLIFIVTNLQQPWNHMRTLVGIVIGSYTMYRYASHTNRTGDRSFD